jgi:hypothetical protein
MVLQFTIFITLEKNILQYLCLRNKAQTMINQNLILGILVNLVTIFGVSAQGLDATLNQIWVSDQAKNSNQLKVLNVDADDYIGASLQIKAKCNDGIATFRISNIGEEDMSVPTQLGIIEDDILPGYNREVFLQSGKHIDIELDGNSKVTLILRQIKGHPGDSILTATLEGCGTLNKITSHTGSQVKNVDPDQHQIANGSNDVDKSVSSMDAVILSQHFDQTSSIGGNINFKVFPNPASDVLNIEIPSVNTKTNLYLYDVLGHIIWSNTLDKGQHFTSVQLNTVNVTYSGIYFLKAQSDQVGLTQRINLIKL